MNKVILMGRLTRDAEVRYSQGESSSAIARFTLAVDRRFRRNNEDQTADFISCVAFSKTAEFLERFGRKGGDNSGFNPSDRPSPSSAAGDGFMNIPDGIDEELPFN